MKKYIFTESQVKRIMDGVVEEQLLTEQTSELNAKKAIQCFLNKVIGSKLEVDGLHGDATSEAIAKFQRSKSGLDMDGVWGYSTGSSLNDKEKKIMKDCRSEHGDIIDKFLNWLGL
jgi:hypothetical protein